ncbi:uncharacterized protein BDZ99DRAFT_460047 [Mytilinidion resinicola]|uniref:Phospholipase D n=1 Tax=Mytilinidion resinicola TaxID=574789 RepID=A0A6A6YZX6_9PEZI|nr:uncharacterized protein BDZ99DRAFT_460047 [Mytilinidion resinicola]KAF2814391.1 hypothetical protein BDZ99DRAFT_460047 [Mytilinidion resinicola]
MQLIHALISSSLLLGSALASVGTQQVLGIPQEKSNATRPVYAIAHRVLMTTGIWDALNDGANALEIDMMPNKNGWNAQHDGAAGRGDTADLMFKTIAEARSQGRTVTFVWLDLKSPDWCLLEHGPKWKHCTIQALRDLAAKYLEPVGVKVLYGFYNGKEKALASIAPNLKSFEAINMNGEAQECLDAFDKVATNVGRSKLIMSYGFFALSAAFGNCHETGYKTCTEVRKGYEMNKFGKVFGWTSLRGHAWYVDKLFAEAGVDGMIYGFKLNHYVGSEATKEAATDILNWAKNHSRTHHVATLADAPW